MPEDLSEWHKRLFSKSVLKQAKWREIGALLPDLSGCRGLDLGADNGIISHLLRERGGKWLSADIDAGAVSSIHSLVGPHVVQIEGGALPFAEAQFDVVVIVDMLEHLEDDAALARETARVLRPGGWLIVNVPHDKRLALLRPLRLALGLTDAWHGHARPGYTIQQLRGVLGTPFEIVTCRTYNRFFSELLDIALNCAYARRSGRNASRGIKGTLLTRGDIGRHERSFRWYSRLYPLMRLVAALDMLVRPTEGYSLVAAALRKGDPGGR